MVDRPLTKWDAHAKYNPYLIWWNRGFLLQIRDITYSSIVWSYILYFFLLAEQWWNSIRQLGLSRMMPTSIKWNCTPHPADSEGIRWSGLVCWADLGVAVSFFCHTWRNMNLTSYPGENQHRYGKPTICISYSYGNRRLSTTTMLVYRRVKIKCHAFCRLSKISHTRR